MSTRLLTISQQNVPAAVIAIVQRRASVRSVHTRSLSFNSRIVRARARAHTCSFFELDRLQARVDIRIRK